MTHLLGYLPTIPPVLGKLWLPDQASSVAPGVDSVFNLILGVCTVFFLIVVVTLVLFVVKYRKRPGVTAQKTPTHNMKLEILWSVIPLVIVIYIFWKSFTVFMNMYTVPSNAYEIHVTAQKWSWSFTYPNGYVDENLHVPVDRPIRLIMSSKDVIHSLWIPKFRMKMDIPPGRYTSMWFTATEVGIYNLLCTEYCGEAHSDMLAVVQVHPEGEFEPWLKDAANFLDKFPPAEAGEMLYTRRGCTQCHSNDGTARTGPTFKGIFGETHQFSDGSSAAVDENYIRESILNPQAKIRAGFQGVMPTYKGVLKDEEISVIIEYIKTLK